MSYYYIENGKKFIDSSHPIDDDKLVQINEVQYAITRLLVMGYTVKEIHTAVDEVEQIMKRTATK